MFVVVKLSLMSSVVCNVTIMSFVFLTISL